MMNGTFVLEMARCATEIRMEKIKNYINKILEYNLRNYTE